MVWHNVSNRFPVRQAYLQKRNTNLVRRMNTTRNAIDLTYNGRNRHNVEFLRTIRLDTI